MKSKKKNDGKRDHQNKHDDDQGQKGGHHRGDNQNDPGSNDDLTTFNNGKYDAGTTAFLAKYHVDGDTIQYYKLAAGTAGNDVLSASDMRTALLGRDGDDILQGGRAQDAFYGGAGNDTITGGGHTDWFNFRIGDGHDVITDFQIGDPKEDYLIIFGEGTLVGANGKKDINQTDFLDQFAKQSGDSVIITLNANDSIELQHTSLADLYAHSGQICLWLP